MRPRRRVLLTLAAALAWSGCAESPTPTAEVTAAPPADATPTADPRAPFVGNWELVRVERFDDDGNLLPPPDPPAFGSEGALGYIMYDPGGYMGVVIMQPERPPYAGDEPTPDEALGALASYTSYFGTYTVNEAEGYLTHHLQGNVRPPASSNDNQRFYELSGDQLILMPPASGSRRPSRIVWRRVPELPESELTDSHRKLVGFYRFVRLERTTAAGESLDVEQWDRAFIIYTRSGHMAVHIVPSEPTELHGRADAGRSARRPPNLRQLLRPFSVNEEDGYLIHHRVGHLNPGQAGTDAQRFFELTDDTLTLRPPPGTVNGQPTQAAIIWERLR